MDFYSAFVVELATNLNYEFGRLDSPARVAIHFIHRAWAIVAAVAILLLSIISYRTIYHYLFSKADLTSGGI